ncbi:undecaprenyl/decaprenyl-phosphate alpha-N-acetylglucosaminyl 1-phosphate transferase, partial [Candidatus Saccharibacteria bacterium]|nr:undecaprenyl/decaprenyl-phosphate alpha-N-acetylglucosaminyl 1-phosphate transferase [Candidatus Saccharibacteria bacterium]
MQTAVVSIALAGGCIGYLVYNFHPAKIFNGDSGAYFLGMTLGIIAIFSGGKLATAALVLGVPIIDALWAALRRILAGRSPFSADRGHLH